MTKQDFLRQLERALEREPGSLGEDVRLADVDWDSLGELTFVALADQHLGVRVSAQAVSDCTQMRELLALVEPRLTA